MGINYEPIGWDSTKFFGPTNMNHMDDGIKAACDGVDELTTEVAAANESLGTKNLKTYTDITQFGLESADTIEAIITALPSYSELIYGVNAGSALATSLPLNGNAGELRVTKTTSYNGGRGRIECKDYRSKAVHINYYYNGTLGAWDTNALNSDLAEKADKQWKTIKSFTATGVYTVSDMSNYSEIMLVIGTNGVSMRASVAVPYTLIANGRNELVASYYVSGREYTAITLDNNTTVNVKTLSGTNNNIGYVLGR